MLFHFRHQVAQLDQELVRVTALQVVFDLLLTFGLEAFKVNTSVPELEHVEPSTNGSEQEKSDNEDDGNEEGEDDDEKRDDDDDVELYRNIPSASTIPCICCLYHRHNVFTRYHIYSLSLKIISRKCNLI